MYCCFTIWLQRPSQKWIFWSDSTGNWQLLIFEVPVSLCPTSNPLIHLSLSTKIHAVFENFGPNLRLMLLDSGLEMFRSDHPWLSMAGLWPKRWYPLQTKWSTVAILVFLLLSCPVWENCNVGTWWKSLVFLQWGSGGVIFCVSKFCRYLEGNYLTGDIPEELGNLSQLMAL